MQQLISLLQSQQLLYLPKKPVTYFICSTCTQICIAKRIRLDKFSLLELQLDSELAASIFIIPKKNGTLRFFHDFQKHKKKVVSIAFPTSKTRYLILKLQEFQWTTAHDLYMGSYNKA